MASTRREPSAVARPPGRWLDGRPAVATLALVTYAVSAPLLVRSLGAGTAALALVPAVLAGLTWGPVGGLLAGLALTVCNIAVLNVLLGTEFAVEVYRTAGTMGSVIVVAGGVTAGHLRNVHRRMHREVLERESAQRELEEALGAERSLRAQLERQDAMKNLFLRAVGHDLRSPLVPIVSGVELLHQRFDQLDPSTRERILDGVTRHARVLRRQMDALLDVDRLTAGEITPHPGPTDVGTLLTETVAAVVPPERTVEIRSVPTAQVDPDLLERILENLLGNAVKHTDVTVPLRLTAATTADGLLVSLEQVGATIDEGLAGRLFNAYQRGPHAGAPGHGLGLSLVAGFAELHGGYASVETTPSGAVFRVLLAPLS